MSYELIPSDETYMIAGHKDFHDESKVWWTTWSAGPSAPLRTQFYNEEKCWVEAGVDYKVRPWTPLSGATEALRRSFAQMAEIARKRGHGEHS